MAPTPGSKQCEIVLVGCGAPLRGMGWYHAQQLLNNECPSGKLCYVVEPWFMGQGATGPGGPEFTKFMEDTKRDHGVEFFASIQDLPAPKANRLALISGRTADNPRLLQEAITVRLTCKKRLFDSPNLPNPYFLFMYRQTARLFISRNLVLLLLPSLRV